MAGKVLVVDDDASVQRLLQFTLQQEGYEVLVAADGADGSAPLADGVALADPARRHGPAGVDGYEVATRIRAEEGRRPARPDHHAHVRRGRAGQGPRAPGGRRRLPHQAVPPGRAARPDEEPHRALRAERVARGPAADGPRPRLLRREGRRRHDDDRDQRRDRAPGPRPAGLPRRRQPPVRRPPGVPRPRPRPQEHRRPRERAGDGRGPRQEHRPAPTTRASTCCSPRRRPRPPTS